MLRRGMSKTTCSEAVLYAFQTRPMMYFRMLGDPERLLGRGEGKATYSEAVLYIFQT
jgi:hypothetical protein